MKKIAALLPLLILLSCSTGPDAPVLVFPENGATITNLPFQWRSVSEATDYLFQIGSEPTFSSPLISSVDSDTFYTLTAAQQTIFQSGVTYYWHVYSMSDKIRGDESSIREFTVAGGKP